MPIPRVRSLLRRLALVSTLPILSSAIWLSAAGPAFACDCAGPQPMATYKSPDSVVFAGVAGQIDGRGVPVSVTTWYHGTGAAPLVYLAKSGFGNDGMCGTATPVAGTGWIWVAWIPEGGGDPQASLCLPSAQLGTADGNAMTADAKATFGGAPPPGANVETGAPGPNVPADAAVPVLVATFAVGAALFAAVALLARRRSRRAGDTG